MATHRFRHGDRVMSGRFAGRGDPGEVIEVDGDAITVAWVSGNASIVNWKDLRHAAPEEFEEALERSRRVQERPWSGRKPKRRGRS